MFDVSVILKEVNAVPKPKHIEFAEVNVLLFIMLIVAKLVVTNLISVTVLLLRTLIGPDATAVASPAGYEV